MVLALILITIRFFPSDVATAQQLSFMDEYKVTAGITQEQDKTRLSDIPNKNDDDDGDDDDDDDGYNNKDTELNLPFFNCPCSKPQYCLPISGPPINPRGELYGFYGSNNNYFVPTDLNFTYLTTVAWAFHNDEVTCIAHENNVRVIQASPYFNLTYLSMNETAIMEWILNALELVQRTFRDGIVFDYEEPFRIDSIEAVTYTKLIQTTRQVFQQSNPSYQISTCLAWSPDSIDGRSYPYNAIADSSDLVYVMMYDVQSQIMNSACIAGANSPYGAMVRGIERYLEIGIDRKKIVLGVPWYGYRYPCILGSMKPNDHYCPLQYKPFRDVKCSDAIGKEYDYSVIMNELRMSDTAQTGGLQWDENMESPFFNTIDTNSTTTRHILQQEQEQKQAQDQAQDQQQIYQYWFDNPTSLRKKYKWAKEQRLLGVGPFTINNVNPHTNKDTYQDSIEMWSALDEFFVPISNTIRAY